MLARLPPINYRFYHWLGVSLILTLSIFLLVQQLGFLTSLEHRFYDWRLRLSLAETSIQPSPHAILAAIDEQAISQIGRFPWSRSVWARVVDKLAALGAEVVAFDMIFSEEETACEGDPDSQLARAIERFPHGAENVIVGYSRTPLSHTASKTFPSTLYNQLLGVQQTGEDTLYPYFVQRSTFPIPTLATRDLGLGFIDMQDDADGVFRHYTTVSNIVAIEDFQQSGLSQLFPSFGLLSYMRYRRDDTSATLSHNASSVQLNTQQGILELDGEGATRLRYRGGRESFREISLWDILNDSGELAAVIQGKAVFIASTAFAAHDFRNAPVDSQIPGVFFHMSLLDMISEGRFFRSWHASLLASLILLLVSSLLLLTVQSRKSIPLDLAGAALVMGLNFLWDSHYFFPQGFEVRLLTCLASNLALVLWNGTCHFCRINREKRQIRGTFSHYVSPGIVNEILKHPDKLATGGERRDITVLFSDVRDFTSISEKLPPTQLSHCLNQYMNEMTHILFRYQGTLDKYIGDAIVGYWGAPIPLPNHPTLAVQAALEMIEVLPQINTRFKQQGYPEFRVGIGLNTGECSVGNMGSDMIFSYTAIGDHMNLGARMEGLCKHYGAQIILSQFTMERLEPSVREQLALRHLDLVRVKGREAPASIYQLLPSHHPLYSDVQSRENYHSAHQAFLQWDFATSSSLLAALLARYPEDLAVRHLLQRSREYQKNPPPAHWDGVTTMTSK